MVLKLAAGGGPGWQRFGSWARWAHLWRWLAHRLAHAPARPRLRGGTGEWVGLKCVAKPALQPSLWALAAAKATENERGSEAGAVYENMQRAIGAHSPAVTHTPVLVRTQDCKDKMKREAPVRALAPQPRLSSAGAGYQHWVLV